MGKISRLNEYLSEVCDVPFEWGVHDCFTFTNGAWKAMYGQGWAEDWLGKYMIEGKVMGRDELRKTFRFGGIDAALRSRRTPDDRPVLCSLVTTERSQRWMVGVAMGISLGSRCVFLSKDGLIKLNAEDVQSSWVPNVKI